MTSEFFWKKWIKADDLERIKLVETLPICKTLLELFWPKINKEQASFSAATILNSYFEDLYGTIKNG